MGHIHLVLEPHRYGPMAARAEAEAARVARADKKAKKDSGSDEGPEPFERYLADAYAALLSAVGTGTGTGGKTAGRAKRPETVVLVSHPVAKRGWTHVRPGEVCKVPGIGPVSPQVARQIAADALLTGVLRRHRSPADEAVEPQHPGRGRAGVGARPSTGLRRRAVRGLRQPLPHRVRPRRTARGAGAVLDGEPQAALLELSRRQDRAGSSRRQAPEPAAHAVGLALGATMALAEAWHTHPATGRSRTCTVRRLHPADVYRQSRTPDVRSPTPPPSCC
jgi:hypothetical protein